jgi:hypothetical protein
MARAGPLPEVPRTPVAESDRQQHAHSQQTRQRQDEWPNQCPGNVDPDGERQRQEEPRGDGRSHAAPFSGLPSHGLPGTIER